MMTAESDTVVARAAAAGAPVKRQYVRAMFSDIAPRYDLLNRVLSIGIDRAWRRAAVRALAWDRQPDGRYLDLCAGTMDVARHLATRAGFRGSVLAADFAQPMLEHGRAKTARLPITPVVADAATLPVADGACAGAIVAFGIRNVANLAESLVEVRRVLAPGARFVILELSTPTQRVMRAAYHFYFRHVLPVIGTAVSGHATAYRYLPESVAHFPEGDALAEAMRRAGYRRVEWRALTGGIAALHVGVA